MATYGLLSTGFVPKTLTVIRADLDAAMRGAFGQSMNCGDASVLGQIDGIMAERLAELWALAQAVYSSQDADQATGQALDAICALTGTLRPPPSSSQVTETLVGTTGTTVPSGTIVQTASTGLQFKTTFSGVLAALPAWVGSSAYTVGNRVTNAGNAYQCITAGTSASSGGPTTTASSINDGTVVWEFLGVGVAAADVTATSLLTGPIVASAGDLTVIVTPVSGLNSVINLTAASLGVTQTSDGNLRILRQSQLAGGGAGTANAIRAAVLAVSGVTAATIIYNDGDTTDAFGDPPHSVQCVVTGGADAAVAAAIFGQVAAGINTFGTSSQVVVDSQGTNHTVAFTRPTQVNIFVAITLTYDATKYPFNGDSAVQAAIAALLYPNDLDVFAPQVAAAVYAAVPGVLDVEPTYIGLSSNPGTSTPIPISATQQAVFLSANVIVHSSAATP